MSSFFLNTPLSLYSIPLAWATAFYPHNRRFALISKTIGWNNLNPRDISKESLIKRGMKPEAANKVEMYSGAHMNGNEIFPLWVSAVIVANVVGIPQSTRNIVSGVFIVSRFLFNYLYINQTKVSTSRLRTLAYVVSALLPMYLLIISANKARLDGA